MDYNVYLGKTARRHFELVKQSAYLPKVLQLIDILKHNPYQTPPEYEKLIGDLRGAYSRRINAQHRLVYEVHEEEHAVKILSMWSHYE